MDGYSAIAPFPVMWLETIVEGSLIKVHACQIFLKTQGMPFQRGYIVSIFSSQEFV
jgi:hypothetical protein